MDFHLNNTQPMAYAPSMSQISQPLFSELKDFGKVMIGPDASGGMFDNNKDNIIDSDENDVDNEIINELTQIVKRKKEKKKEEENSFMGSTLMWIILIIILAVIAYIYFYNTSGSTISVNSISISDRYNDMFRY